MTLTMADLKPTLLNLFLFLLFAAATIPAAKYFLALYHVPGLSELVAAI